MPEQHKAVDHHCMWHHSVDAAVLTTREVQRLLWENQECEVVIMHTSQRLYAARALGCTTCPTMMEALLWQIGP